MKRVLWLFLGFIILAFGTANFVDSREISAAEMPKIIGHSNKGQPLLPGPKDGHETQSYVNNKLLPGLTNIVFIFILSISVGAIIIAGIFYLISNGDSESVKRAKDIILWTILGVLIAALSYVIVQIIISTNFLE